mgnify:CR=1 FL=1
MNTNEIVDKYFSESYNSLNMLTDSDVMWGSLDLSSFTVQPIEAPAPSGETPPASATMTTTMTTTTATGETSTSNADMPQSAPVKTDQESTLNTNDILTLAVNSAIPETKSTAPKVTRGRKRKLPTVYEEISSPETTSPEPQPLMRVIDDTRVRAPKRSDSLARMLREHKKRRAFFKTQMVTEISMEQFDLKGDIIDTSLNTMTEGPGSTLTPISDWLLQYVERHRVKGPMTGETEAITLKLNLKLTLKRE